MTDYQRKLHSLVKLLPDSAPPLMKAIEDGVKLPDEEAQLHFWWEDHLEPEKESITELFLSAENRRLLDE